ncbi:MAG: glycosyltransferase family 2 protein [Succinivibrio sp.]|nr:glycosyltransferase family 2 protein [Succinivibrio sp.]
MSQVHPLVSIIVPVYNTEAYLRECLDSVYSQTFKDFEIICVNDGSPDNSINILNEYKQKFTNFRYFNQSNQGLSTTRNNGIKQALGKYILPLDSDDILEKNCVKRLVDALETGVCDIATPEVVNFYSDGHLYHCLFPAPTPCNMAQANCIVCTSLFPKKFFELYGGYDTINFKVGEEDYDLWCRFIENNKTITRIKSAIFFYRVKDINESMRLKFKDNYEIRNRYKEIRRNRYSFVRKYSSFRYVLYKRIVRYTKRYFKYIYQCRLDPKACKYEGFLFSKIKLFTRYF